jgi:hypothetical protein
MSIVLPNNEAWAQNLDLHLADLLLGQVYTGWKEIKK